MKDKKYIFYVAVGNLKPDDIKPYIEKVKEQVGDFFGEGRSVFYVPVRNENSHIVQISDYQDKLLDSLETAWGIISNSSNWDDGKGSPGWRDTAVRWRDKYFKLYGEMATPDIEEEIDGQTKAL